MEPGLQIIEFVNNAQRIVPLATVDCLTSAFLAKTTFSFSREPVKTRALMASINKSLTISVMRVIATAQLVMEKHKWIAFLATSPFILKANSALRNVLWAIIGILRQEFAKIV